jgi:RNA polymerase sigma-70 factor (ECF subfamily)
MIGDIQDFKGLLCRISEGDASAAWDLVEYYGEDIRNAVRRSLNRRLRPKFDSLDFVQLVWSSFFRQRSFEDRFGSPEELISYLIAMARNKVGMETRRRLMSQKYNVNRESSLDQRSPNPCEELATLQPAPLEFAIAKERWNQLLSDSPNHYRQIVQFRLQGQTCREIAESLHLDESTVRRFLKRLQQNMSE